MRAESLLPRKCSPGVATFLSLVDEVRYDASLPTSATGLVYGKLVLLLGEQFAKGNPRERDEMLRHEAGHFYLSHCTRFPGEPGTYDMTLWNYVTDAAMHSIHNCHQDDDRAVTWEKLGLSPMSPELAYEILKERQQQVQGCSSCGSLEHSSNDGTTESRMKAIEATVKMDDSGHFHSLHRSGGYGSGGGGHIELAPPPAWIRDTLDYLVSAMAMDERRRSWRRENRQSPLLPGNARSTSRAGLFLIDSSASISDETLGKFIGAVQSTPELQGSECIIFDGEPSERVPVALAQQTLANHGRGGTAFLPPAKARRPGEAVVWLTDGYPCDGWPMPHVGPEIWCITTDITPPHGVRIDASA